jgi:HSP20 family molecular chaperone IbpA
MNETRELIAQKAYEIYQSRGGAHGFDQGDWFSAENEILQPVDVKHDVTAGAVRVRARIAGFDAKDLEVILGHRRAVICGVHSEAGRGDGEKKWRAIRIVELPFDVNPTAARATYTNGTLEAVFPR